MSRWSPRRLGWWALAVVVVLGSLSLAGDPPPDLANPSVHEVVTIDGADGTVWELGVQGYVRGPAGNRSLGECATVLFSVRLVSGPSDGRYFLGNVELPVLLVGGEEVPLQTSRCFGFSEEPVASAIEGRWGDRALFLPGSKMGAYLSFELPRDVDPTGLVVRFGTERRVEFRPRHLQSVPPPIVPVAGPLTRPLLSADTVGSLRLSDDRRLDEMRVHGVEVVWVDEFESWCVIVYASAVLDHEHPGYLGDPRVGVIASGFVTYNDSVSSCLDGERWAWNSLLIPPYPPAGTRVSIAAGGHFPFEPDVQAVWMQVGSVDDFEWVLFEADVLDSPPPGP